MILESEKIGPNEGQIDSQPFVPATQDVEKADETRAARRMKILKSLEVHRDTEEQKGGTEKQLFCGNGAVKVIRPHYRVNLDADTYWARGDAVEYAQVRVSTPRTNIFAAKGYTKHLIDPEFNEKVAAHLNGKLYRWRADVMNLAKRVMASNLYRKQPLWNQFNWANDKILRVIRGIDELKSFPVELLNRRAMLALIGGVDDEETIRMVNCRSFSCISKPTAKPP